MINNVNHARSDLENWDCTQQMNRQVEDMKDQKSYLASYRSALKQALQEVTLLRGQIAENQGKVLVDNTTQTDFREGGHGSVSKDMDVVHDAEEKLKRIKKNVIERNEKIARLRTQLLHINTLLTKRESKLEQKLGIEYELKQTKHALETKLDSKQQALLKAEEHCRQERNKSHSIEEENVYLKREVDALRSDNHNLRQRLLDSEGRVLHFRKGFQQEREYSHQIYNDCIRLQRNIDRMKVELDHMRLLSFPEYRTGDSRYQHSKDQTLTQTRGLARNSGVLYKPLNAQRNGKLGARFSGQQLLSPIQEDGEDSKHYLLQGEETAAEAININLNEGSKSKTSIKETTVHGTHHEKPDTCVQSQTDVCVTLDKPEKPNSSLEQNAYPYLVVDTRRHVARNLCGEFDDDKKQKLPLDVVGLPVNETTEHDGCSNNVVAPVAFRVSSPASSNTSLHSARSSNIHLPNDVNCATSQSSGCSSLTSDASRSARKKKSSKYIRYCGHKIDVTNFTMQRFRDILWSTCDADHSADQFIEFLALNARRLQDDPKWHGKHTLGSASEWLSLKGCY